VTTSDDTHAATTTTELGELLRAVERWVGPAAVEFSMGYPVALTFSPGDGTRYPFVFVPGSSLVSHVTRDEHPACADDAALLVMPSWNVVQQITPHGDPHPYYVAEKLGEHGHNLFTVAAVTVVWQLMVGHSAEHVESVVAGIPEHVWAEWQPERFAVER
jgi:hypothetical protein